MTTALLIASIDAISESNCMPLIEDLAEVLNSPFVEN